MEEKLDLMIQMTVKGKETVTATIEYKGTNKKTVVAVENAMMEALATLNEESLK